MFVEQLSKEEQLIILQKLIKEEKKLSIYSSKEIYIYNNDRILKFVFGKRGKIDYELKLSDSYLSSGFKSLDSLEHLSRICFKELYRIFGEEYKDYYMQQVDKIFE